MNLDAQALAAFGAPGIQYFPTTFGRHAGTEAVGTLTLQVAWLKSSLHLPGSGSLLVSEL
jgi:hypothetical protein